MEVAPVQQLPEDARERLLNISKVLDKGELMKEKEVLEICRQIDSIIAEQLAESIIKGTSYEKLEAHYGILPISRNCFYRRKRLAKKMMDRCE